jgi:ATP-dependent DNA ligase
VVSKLTSSPYRSGRGRTWLWSKCFTESSLIIIGTDRVRKTGVMRALLAKADEHALTYIGAAFIAVPGEAWREL